MQMILIAFQKRRSSEVAPNAIHCAGNGNRETPQGGIDWYSRCW